MLSLLGKLLERRESAVRFDGEAADLDVADTPAAIDDERHPLRQIPRVVPDSVEPAHTTLCLEIAQEAKRQAEMLRPGQIALARIDRDPDDLGVERGELGLVVPEPGEFALSATGERLDEEGNDDEVAAGERIAQPERTAVLIAQRNLGGLVVHRQRLVSIGGERGPGQQRGQQQRDDAAQGVSTAWSTAPRKSCSGTAPSN
jgi:hypothetical protein